MTLQQEILYEMWHDRLALHIGGERELASVMAYVKLMLERDFPIIVGINHLAKLMGIAPDTLKSMVASAHSFYRSFTIPKRRGGIRQIDAPYPVMLKAQRWIYKNILSKVEVNSAAMGFIPGRSIVDNAYTHLNSKCLLMLDVQDFFPSIKWYKVYAVFRRLGYPKHIAQYLSSLCCLNGCIPQGAVTSPALSNVICRRLDARIDSLARAFEIKYTRYADDVTFSGSIISRKLKPIISSIFEEEGFNLNEEKTRYIKGTHRKIVTGISISSPKMTVPRSKRREIRKQVHFIRKYGLEDHLNKIQDNDPIYLERLIGYLHFWQFVDPTNTFVVQALHDLGTVQTEREKMVIGEQPAPQQLTFDQYVLSFDDHN